MHEEGRHVGAILYLWPLEDQACVRDYAPVVYLLQAMVAAQLRPARVLLAGQCAPGYSLDRCYLESWIGFERSLGLVLPHIQVAPVYAAASGDPAGAIDEWAARLWHELRTPKARAVLYQDGRRHVCGILSCDLTPSADPFREHGTYLITGGLGGLGLLFARHLAAARPVNLILTGRSAVSAAQQARIDELEALGARVSVLRADVADRAAMRRGLAAAQDRFGSINGVIHAAGVVGGSSLFAKDIEHFHRVLAPKVQGTLVLDEMVDCGGLDFVCYFSSSAAVLGDFGSCDYAIGNRFQMAFARYQTRRSGQERVKALAINWPLWGGVGMGAGDEEHIRMMLKSSGQRHLEANEGLALFDRILAQGVVQPLVLAGQPSRVRRFLGLAPRPSDVDSPHSDGHGALSHRERAADEDPQSPRNARHPLPMGTGQSWVSRNQGDDAPIELGTQPRPETAIDAQRTQPQVSGTRRGGRPEMTGLSLHECAVWDLREHAAQLLQTPREQLRPDENLADFGFDSLSLTDFAASLTAHYGHGASPVNITPSLLFGYPTFDKLAAFLLREYGPALAEFYRETASTPSQAAMPECDATRPAPRPTVYAPVAADRAEPAPWSGGEEPIAVIGMSGRFPQARNVDEMWEILVNGRDAVGPFPDDRFDWWQFHGGGADRTPSRPIRKGEAAAWSCGCIPGVGEFDPLFFEISPVEAEVMDPRQRLLLQEAWNALEDAGYGKSAIEAPNDRHLRRCRTGRLPVVDPRPGRGDRHPRRHARRPARLFPQPLRPRAHHQHRLLLRPGCHPPGLRQPAQPRMRHRPRRRRHARAHPLRPQGHERSRHALRRRLLSRLRQARRRHRARRGRGRPRAQAPVARPSRWRPDPGGYQRQRRQLRRQNQRHHRPQRRVADQPAHRGLPTLRVDPAAIEYVVTHGTGTNWAIPSRSTP